MYMCVCAHVSASTLRVQKRALGPPELELQVAMSHSTLVLGSELGSFARAFILLTRPHTVFFFF